MITGGGNETKQILEFDPEKETIKESKFTLRHYDDSRDHHEGLRVGNLVYLPNTLTLNIVNLGTYTVQEMSGKGTSNIVKPP